MKNLTKPEDVLAQLSHDRSVRVISAKPSIHTYFDVNPESPDGGHYLTYFEFDGKPLNFGKVVVSERDGQRPLVVKCGPGNPHSGARQGWLDAEHLYFSMNGKVSIAHIDGKIVQELSGSIDTIHRGQRKGLTSSDTLLKYGCQPSKEQACYRVDLNDGALVELFDRQWAWQVLKASMDVGSIPLESMGFKHTKWAPDGHSWMVVFTNEKARRSQPEIPLVKVLLLSDPKGDHLTFVGSFSHHPNWFPDSHGIFAFTGPGRVGQWCLDQKEPKELFSFSQEGHPSVSPCGRFIATDYHLKGEDAQAGILLGRVGTPTEEVLITMANPKVNWQLQHPPYRVCHPHPVWNESGERLYFNAIAGELPYLCVMDMK